MAIRACRSSAITSSPSKTSPRSSIDHRAIAVAVERDPDVARSRTTVSRIFSGWTAPHPSLILMPWDRPIGITSAPISSSTPGRPCNLRRWRNRSRCACSRSCSARHAGFQEYQVPPDGIVDPRRLADVAAARARRASRAVVEDQFLDFASVSSSSLNPSREKNLIPLSWKGLCEAEITTPASARILRSERRCPESARADQPYVDAHRADPRGDRGLEHVAGKSGVLADQNLAMTPAADPRKTWRAPVRVSSRFRR